MNLKKHRYAVTQLATTIARCNEIQDLDACHLCPCCKQDYLGIAAPECTFKLEDYDSFCASFHSVIQQAKALKARASRRGLPEQTILILFDNFK